MEAKLREYRALKRRKELIDNAKEKLENTKQKLTNLLVPKIFSDMHKEKPEDEVLLLQEEAPPTKVTLIQPEEESSEDDEPIENPCLNSSFIIKWSFYIMIWLAFYIFFLRIGFGAVYFVISLLIGIFLNTRTRKKRKGEVSAYSVFNKNCVSIDGTLKAEQFEREIRYGAGTVRPF